MSPILSTLAVCLAGLALLWDYLYPFPQSRPVLAACACSYFALMAALQLYIWYAYLVPVLLGATAMKTLDLVRDLPDSTLITAYVVGGAAAFISGYFALRLLLGIVHRGHLDRFGWYCLLVGAVALAFLL